MTYHDMDFGFVAHAAALDDLSELARHTLRCDKELTKAAGMRAAS